MQNYAFLSRHTPTPEQHALAAAAGITLHHKGDIDAFVVTPADVEEMHAGGPEIDGVIVVHPAAALRLIGSYNVGVFENGARSAEDGKPTFFAVALHFFKFRTSTEVGVTRIVAS